MIRRVREVDVAVIGAGPAGMTAATEAACAGLSVVLLDEQPAPGGQIYRATERAGAARLRILGADYAEGKPLVDAFRASGAEYLPGATVWNVGTNRMIDYSKDGAIACLRAESVVAATGALERSCPIPGWTLPGVITVGALQILLKGSGLVEEGALLAGAGPLLWLVAAQLVEAGAPPRAVVETLPKGRLPAALPHLPRALRAWHYLRKGRELIAAVRRAGVPIQTNATDLAVEGDRQAVALSFRSGGRDQRIEAGVVALHQGVIPNQQVSRLMGCEHRWDVAQHCFRPVLDDDFQTSVPGLYVGGDAAGIGGAKAAALQGRIIGTRLAEEAGKPARLSVAAMRAELAGDLSIRPFLEALYAPEPLILAPADGTMVCRCEEITAGEIRAMVRLGAPGPNQLKSLIRTGMGPCQGRVCGIAVSSIIAAARGETPEPADYYRIRPPLKPVPMVELAAYPEIGPEVEAREP